jgi:RNA polymerase primary sigma factor
MSDSDRSIKSIFIQELDEVSPKGEKVNHAQVREWITEYRQTQITEIRDRIIYSGIRWVLHWARFYVVRTKRYDIWGDLVQEGVLGLLHAIDKYDVKRGEASFNTYSTYWILQAMQRYLQNNLRDVRIPVHLQDTLARNLKALRGLDIDAQKFFEEWNRIESRKNQKDNLYLQDFLERYAIDQEYQEIDPESFTVTHLEFPEQLKVDCPSGDYVVNIHTEEVKVLSYNYIQERRCTRDAQMFLIRHGLTEYGEFTLQEVGDMFHITRERVRQIMEVCLSFPYIRELFSINSPK